MFGNKFICVAIGVLLGTQSSSSTFGQAIWYVDPGASGPAHDGTSWCRAYLTVHQTLNTAAAGDRIRVAQGVYKPDQTGLPIPRNATFKLKSGVMLEGGFAGCGAVNPDARDFVAYNSTLSGDLNGDDGPNFSNYADNAYHVVTYDDPAATGVVLEGFTILGGNANGASALTNQGGGIHIRNGLAKCLPGGPTIRYCVIEKNWGAHHGAINDHGLSTVIEDCIIRDNHSGQEGGGLQIHSGSPVVSNCLFFNNTSASDGGGAWVGSDSDPTCTGASTARFINCVFDGNHAALGGGIFTTLGAEPTIASCTFVHNVAQDGAGLYTKGSDASVSNCLFVENNANSQGGGAYNNTNGTPMFTDCTFRGNTAGLYGGGMRNLDSNPLLTGCIFSKNSSATNGGALHNRRSSPTFDRCAFFGNNALSDGGALFNIEGSSLAIRDSLFAGNVAQQGGGAMSNNDVSHPRLHNCTFYGNVAMPGFGAIENDSQSTALLTNSIVRNHAGGAFGGLGATTATYSNIQSGWAGVGNIDAAPLFVDADGPDGLVGTEDDDLRLKRDSPGINVGDPAFVPASNELDLARGSRVVECRVDMGAHESITLQEPGDFNADHVINLADFAWFQQCAFAPAQHPDWDETCRCVFDFDDSQVVDLLDLARLPWDRQPCDEGDDASCSDGDACNGVERCIDRACQPGTPMECDDGNLCTDDACQGGVCVQINNAVFCNDDNACTLDDHCRDGACGGTPLDCDDQNVCTTDGCAPDAGCWHVPNTVPCNDGDACTSHDACSKTICVSGPATLCDDGNACTDDSCDSSSGCIFTNNDANLCDDGNVCNGVEACNAGACVGGVALVCDDANPCTDDSCDLVDGCLYATDDANSCDDGNFCNGSESCVAGVCLEGVTLACDDGNPCTDDACDPQAGCLFANDDSNACDDANPCNGLEVCKAGVCVPGAPPDCDDHSSCTDDSCDTLNGCVHSADDTNSCDDSDVCNGIETCDAGACAKGTPLVCNDGNPCTDDTCDPSSGCIVTNNDSLSCADEDVCNGLEGCVLGVCVPGSTLVCDDLNPCTDDSCESSVGCVFVNDDGNSCDDADACNGIESCIAGTCTEGTALICDDGNSCTDDACDPSMGCVYAEDDSNQCDDANVCTIADQCLNGRCEGVGVDCSQAGDACHTAECDPTGLPENCDVLTPIPDAPGCK